jgi:hypothetical protein
MGALVDSSIATEEQHQQALPTLTRIVAMLVNLIRSVQPDRPHYQRG